MGRGARWGGQDPGTHPLNALCLQVPPQQVKPEDGRDAPERGQVAEGCSSPGVLSPSPSVGGCLSPSRPHAETYKRLFSSFYPKGTHPIMSPLAKKKLLAQVTKAEAGHCHQRPWPEGRQPASHGGPSPEPTGPAAGPPCLHERRSPEPPGAADPAASTGSEVGPAARGSDRCQPCPQAEEGAPAPAVFTGCFHAYRSEGLKPAGCHPLWGYFSSLKDCLEPPNTFPARPDEPERPQDLQGKAGRRWSRERRPAAVQGCWVPPAATFAPKRGREEETASGAKLRALSPFVAEADGRDAGTGLPGGLAKPKAVVASPGYASPLPPAPDGYKGAMLHFPASFGNPLKHLKSQGVPVAPALSVNPFVVPAFPSPLVASVQPSELGRPLATGPGRYPASYESSLRHRLYPAAAWHSPPPYGSPHPTAFRRHAKL